MSNPLRLLGPVVVVVALALTAQAASAMPIVDAPVHNSAPIAATHVASLDAVSSTGSTSFDWGSAAVGGGSVLILVALVAGGLAAAGRSRVTSTR